MTFITDNQRCGHGVGQRFYEASGFGVRGQQRFDLAAQGVIARASVTQESRTLTGRAFERSLKQLIYFSPSLRLLYGSPLALNSILVVWRQSAARSPHPQTPNRSDKPASKSSPSS